MIKPPLASEKLGKTEAVWGLKLGSIRGWDQNGKSVEQLIKTSPIKLMKCVYENNKMLLSWLGLKIS